MLLQVSPPSFLLFTDTSWIECGVCLQDMTTEGIWTSLERELHISLLEMKAVSLKCLLTQDHGRDLSSSDQQHYTGGISQKPKGNVISGHVKTGSDHCLVRATHGQHLGKIHSGKE